MHWNLHKPNRSWHRCLCFCPLTMEWFSLRNHFTHSLTLSLFLVWHIRGVDRREISPICHWKTLFILTLFTRTKILILQTCYYFIEDGAMLFFVRCQYIYIIYHLSIQSDSLSSESLNSWSITFGTDSDSCSACSVKSIAVSWNQVREAAGNREEENGGKTQD